MSRAPRPGEHSGTAVVQSLGHQVSSGSDINVILLMDNDEENDSDNGNEKKEKEKQDTVKLPSSTSQEEEEEDESVTDDTELEELRVEHLLNSSETNAILENLKLEMSPCKPIQPEELIKILSDNDDEDVEDEFPLFPERKFGAAVIDEERVLTTPEKKLMMVEDITDEGSISKRTRSALSPISVQRMCVSQYSQAPSKIPTPMVSSSLPMLNRRRSKRIESQDVDYDRTRCVPKHVEVCLRPALKLARCGDTDLTSLNMIVDCQSGLLHEATRYATQINALNGEGVRLPQTTHEQVQVPLSGARRSLKKCQTAIVRGYQVKSSGLVGDAAHNGKLHTLGFYTHAQYKKYCVSPSKVVKAGVRNSNHGSVRKEVRWASELEW